jgi:hypothetical protein
MHARKKKTGKEMTFAELETVLFTWYQHSVTDADREHIVGLKKSFSIETKFCQEAKDNV